MIQDQSPVMERARQVIDLLAANGGTLILQPAEPDGLSRVLIDYAPHGADRSRCRALLAEAKANAGVWLTVVDMLEAEASKARVPKGTRH